VEVRLEQRYRIGKRKSHANQNMTRPVVSQYAVCENVWCCAKSEEEGSSVQEMNPIEKEIASTRIKR
jgi:hypothetical protein